jgi:glycerophosphoryl diester phosphodiesterase
MRQMSPRPILLGHRGARSTRNVPENSIVSFDLALEQGCDGFEFDLRRSVCGEAIVHHDPRIAGVPISRASCEQLKHVPRLEDVLRHYGPRVFLDIELKVRGLESSVIAALRQHSPLNYVVSSFIPDIVMELKARSAVVPVGIICEKPSQLMRWRKLPVEYVIVHRSLLTQKLVRIVHEAGKKLFVWTINDERSMQRLAGWGADGIISDNPQLLAHTFASLKSSSKN